MMIYIYAIYSGTKDWRSVLSRKNTNHSDVDLSPTGDLDGDNHISFWGRCGITLSKIITLSGHKINDPKVTHAQHLGKVMRSENASSHLFKRDL